MLKYLILVMRVTFLFFPYHYHIFNAKFDGNQWRLFRGQKRKRVQIYLNAHFIIHFSNFWKKGCGQNTLYMYSETASTYFRENVVQITLNKRDQVMEIITLIQYLVQRSRYTRSN